MKGREGREWWRYVCLPFALLIALLVVAVSWLLDMKYGDRFLRAIRWRTGSNMEAGMEIVTWRSFIAAMLGKDPRPWYSGRESTIQPATGQK